MISKSSEVPPSAINAEFEAVSENSHVDDNEAESNMCPERITKDSEPCKSNCIQ